MLILYAELKALRRMYLCQFIKLFMHIKDILYSYIKDEAILSFIWYCRKLIYECEFIGFSVL